MKSTDIKTKKEEITDQMLHLRKRISLLESENNSLRERIGAQQEIAEAIKNTVEALEPLRPIAYKIPRSLHAKSDIDVVLKLSDWHIGEVIRPQENEGINAFNFKIARERVALITNKVLGWTATHRTSFKIPRLHVFCEQDFISGSIHEELLATNEFPAPVQAVKAGNLLGQTIATLAPHFDEVILEEVGGDNHSRLQKKPQAKQKAFNSYGYVVYAIVNQLLSRHKNIRVNQGEGMMQVADVCGWKFLLMHGDTVKAWMGIPFYGLARQRGKEASRRMSLRRELSDVAFDYISCGHWHVPNVIEENIYINGSLSGTTEFDHSCGRHAKPSQMSFLVHPKHGIFDVTNWKA
jgi:hypothetical protein